MPYSTIIYSKNKHVANITLNQTGTDNIINQQLAQEIDEVCQRINQDGEIYAVIITGTKDEAFCGGSELEQPNSRYSPAKAIANIDQPTIAAINGDAIGQGLELAISCDIRLASPQARFGLPQITQGLIPTDGGTQRLPRIIGKAKALELILTGEIIDAGEALKIGLINKIVAKENLASEGKTIAQAITSRAPIALKYAKEAVVKGLDLTLDQGLRLEADLYFLLHTTADRTEGITAFLQKRSPHFKGR